MEETEKATFSAGEREGWRRMAETLQEASAGGRLVRLGEAAAVFLPEIPAEGAVERLRELLPSAGAASGIGLIGEGDDTYLYAEGGMNAAYALLAHRALVSDAAGLIAETVREDSRLYPRPTPLAVFAATPFRLSLEEAEKAVVGMAGDPRYDDIQQVAASDGQVFLYSRRHLDPDLASSLAEWYAVGQFASP